MTSCNGLLPDWINALGPLRAMLLVVVAFMVLGRWFAVMPPDHSTIGALVATIVLPALVPLVGAVLLFDLFMTAVFRSDAAGAERRRLGRCFCADAIAGMALVAIWMPYFGGLPG